MSEKVNPVARAMRWEPTEPQRLAILALADGKSPEEAAEAAGVRPEIVRAWVSNPIFAARVRETQRSLWAQSKANLLATMRHAIEALHERVEAGDPAAVSAALRFGHLVLRVDIAPPDLLCELGTEAKRESLVRSSASPDTSALANVLADVDGPARVPEVAERALDELEAESEPERSRDTP